jgi:hypothetical protein
MEVIRTESKKGLIVVTRDDHITNPELVGAVNGPGFLSGIARNEESVAIAARTGIYNFPLDKQIKILDNVAQTHIDEDPKLYGFIPPDTTSVRVKSILEEQNRRFEIDVIKHGNNPPEPWMYTFDPMKDPSFDILRRSLGQFITDKVLSRFATFRSKPSDIEEYRLKASPTAQSLMTVLIPAGQRSIDEKLVMPEYLITVAQHDFHHLFARLNELSADERKKTEMIFRQSMFDIFFNHYVFPEQQGSRFVGVMNR